MTSKMAIVAGAACVALAATTVAHAASDSGAVKQTVRTLFAKLKAGDSAGATALFAANGSIIDEFAPYHWDSFADWGAAYAAYNTQNGIVTPANTILKFNHVNVDGGRAYAVATVAYTYTERGKARKVPGTEVYSLAKGENGWRIDSFSWFSKAAVDTGADAAAIVDAVHRFASMGTPPSPPPSEIVDEFSPFEWEGTTANADWLRDYSHMSAKAGTSDLAINLAAPSHLSITGDRGYAMFPTVLTFKLHGKPTAEHGAFAFALDKSDGAWHIASWTWATR